jgi:hypothetical protein
MIWNIRNESRLNSEKKCKTWKKGKLNSDNIGKLWKKIVKRFGKYRRKL